MTRKRLLLIGGFLATCGCVLLLMAALMPPTPGVTKANFDRIAVGMSEAQVREILGEDCGYVVGRRICEWEGPDGARAVVAFEGGSVNGKVWSPSRETYLDKLARRLRLW
jgi:hypothetical protein